MIYKAPTSIKNQNCSYLCAPL